MKNEVKQQSMNKRQQDYDEVYSYFDPARNKRKNPTNLQSISEMVYIQNEIPENEIQDNENKAYADNSLHNIDNSYNETNQNENKKMSMLAMRGMALVGDTNFIPIDGNKDVKTEVNTKRGEQSIVNNSAADIVFLNPNDHIEERGLGALYNKQEPLLSTDELYGKLDEIIDLNGTFDPKAKIKTIRKNFDLEMKEFENKKALKNTKK